MFQNNQAVHEEPPFILIKGIEMAYMDVRSRIVEQALALADGKTIADVRLGLGYSSVELDSGEMGLAYTFLPGPKVECTVYEGMRPLVGKPAKIVIEKLVDDDTLASTVALGAANALLNNREQAYLDGDLLKTIQIGVDDHVAMIGAFRPVIRMLKGSAGSLHVFERNDDMEADFLPAEQAFDYLPQSTVAIVTSTTILNGTIDPILEAAAPCREVIMLGASTPLCPEVFAGTPVTALSGVIATDKKSIAMVISEGGGMRIFKDHIRKVTLRLRSGS